MHPWFISSNNPVKHIFSFICMPQEMLQGQAYSVHFFLDPSVLLSPTVHKLSETSNDQALYCMLNHGNILVQLLRCLSLTSYQLESTLPLAVQLLLSQSQESDLVRHHLPLSYVLEKNSCPCCEPLYVTNTSHRKQEIVVYECPFHWVLLATKTYNRTRLFGSTLLKHGRHFDYWNQPLNMCTRICYLDCHEAGLCCYILTHIENLLRPL
jgi:hypothetical protein